MEERGPRNRIGGAFGAMRWRWFVAAAVIVAGAFAAKHTERAAGSAQESSTRPSSAPHASEVSESSRTNTPTKPRLPVSMNEVEEQGRTNAIDPRDAGTTSVEYAHEAARTFRAGRRNAFFDESEFVRTIFGAPGAAMTALVAALRATDDLAALPSDVDFMKDAPDAVVERMAMLDMLATLAQEDRAALAALADLAATPIDPSLPPQAIKAMFGERYDAFELLARRDWDAASAAYDEIENQAMKRALRPALLSGLMNAGRTAEQAQRMVDSI